MRYLLFLLIISHGGMHVVAYLIAENYLAILGLSLEFWEYGGWAWLIPACLFLISGALQLFSNRRWPLVAIVAVSLSQLLIFLNWDEARFGSIANLIILIAAVSRAADYRWKRLADASITSLLATPAPDAAVITEAQIAGLPSPVQKWLKRSGIINQKAISFVRLKQKGEMKTAQNKKWMPFLAEQYFDVVHPSFIWTTKVKFVPFVSMVGCDRFRDGRGEMQIVVLSFFQSGQ